MTYEIKNFDVQEPHFEVTVINDHNDADYQRTDAISFSKDEFEFWMPVILKAKNTSHFWQEIMGQFEYGPSYDKDKAMEFFQEFVDDFEALNQLIGNDDMEEDDPIDYLSDSFIDNFVTRDNCGPHSLDAFEVYFFDENNSRHEVIVHE
jgi:hypothetical protein